MAAVKTVKTVYFSPSGKTKAAAEFIGKRMAELLEAPLELLSYTTPKDRSAWEGDSCPSFGPGDLVIWVSPVYAGRLPNKLLEFVKEHCRGEGAIGLPAVVYGNRSFDNALAELTGIMEDGGMTPAGALAVVARHAFAGIAEWQPDRDAWDMIASFCGTIAERIKASEDGSFDYLEVPGDRHPSEYYVPKKTDGSPAVFLKDRPFVDLNRCTACGTCAKICPMGSMKIGLKGAECTGICIKCHGCVNRCFNRAIFFQSEDLAEHIKMLQENFSEEKLPQLF